MNIEFFRSNFTVHGALLILFMAPIACGSENEDNGVALGRADSEIEIISFSASNVSAPGDALPTDGVARVCVGGAWEDGCDHVIPGNLQSIRVPLVGSITIENEPYSFNVSAINSFAEAAQPQGGYIRIRFDPANVTPGCDVDQGGLLIADMPAFWSNVHQRLVDQNEEHPTTLSWNLDGIDAMPFDGGGCTQIGTPAQLVMNLRLPLVRTDGYMTERWFKLSTSTGADYQLSPLVLTNDAPPSGVLDFVLVIDTTGSMGDDIDAVNDASIELVDSIFSEVPDARVGIIDYKDHPQHPYGDPTDYPHRLVIDFTTDRDLIVAALDSLTANGGNDWDESVYSGLLGAIERRVDDLDGALGPWRTNAKKAIVLLGDAPPHDPEPFTNITLQHVLDAAAGSGVPAPPGPVSLVSGSAQLLDALGNQGVAIYTLQIGGDSNAAAAFQALAAGTGGQSFTTSDAGGVVDAFLAIIGAIGDKAAFPSPLDPAHEIVYNVQPASNAWGTPCSINWTAHTATTNGACLFTLSLQHDDPTISTSHISIWWGSNSPSGPVYYTQILAGNHFTQVTDVAEIKAGDLLAVRYLSAGSYIGYVMIVEYAPELIAGSSTRYLVRVIDSTTTPHGSTDTRWQADSSGAHDQGVGHGDIYIDVDASGAIAGHTWSTGPGSYYSQATRQMAVGRFVR